MEDAKIKLADSMPSESTTAPKATGRSTATSRKPSVDRLLDAAETLFGLHGLEGVSLRQISVASGSANNFAVQYHFGDVGGLVRAILSRRMPEVDARQAAMLSGYDSDGQGHDPSALIDVLLRPILEQVNADGERSYARFISALLRSPQGRVHCKSLFHLTPITLAVLDRLRVVYPELSSEFLEERLRWLSGLVYTSVFNRVEAFASSAFEGELIDDALAVAAAGLALPPPPAFRRPGIAMHGTSA